MFRNEGSALQIGQRKSVAPCRPRFLIRARDELREVKLHQPGGMCLLRILMWSSSEDETFLQSLWRSQSDEFLVRVDIATGLRAAGFIVLEAGDADAAIRILEARSNIHNVSPISICRDPWMDLSSPAMCGVAGPYQTDCHVGPHGSREKSAAERWTFRPET